MKTSLNDHNISPPNAPIVYIRGVTAV